MAVLHYSREKHAAGHRRLDPRPPRHGRADVRLARTAPVSREMILNYVAEHSLGLPKSY